MVGIIEKVKDFEWQGLARVVRNGRVDHDEMDEEQGIASEGSLPPKKSTKRRTHQSFMTSEETEVRNNTIARGVCVSFVKTLTRTKQLTRLASRHPAVLLVYFSLYPHCHRCCASLC